MCLLDPFNPHQMHYTQYIVPALLALAFVHWFNHQGVKSLFYQVVLKKRGSTDTLQQYLTMTARPRTVKLLDCHFCQATHAAHALSWLLGWYLGWGLIPTCYTVAFNTLFAGTFVSLITGVVTDLRRLAHPIQVSQAKEQLSETVAGLDDLFSRGLTEPVGSKNTPQPLTQPGSSGEAPVDADAAVNLFARGIPIPNRKASTPAESTQQPGGDPAGGVDPRSPEETLRQHYEILKARGYEVELVDRPGGGKSILTKTVPEREKLWNKFMSEKDGLPDIPKLGQLVEEVEAHLVEGCTSCQRNAEFAKRRDEALTYIDEYLAQQKEGNTETGGQTQRTGDSA